MSCSALIRLPWREPLEAAAPFADEPWTLLLLSDGSARGRWSYLLRSPREAWLSASGGADPLARLSTALDVGTVEPDGPPFQGGVAGLAAYEVGAWCEPVPLARDPDWPDLAWGVYDAGLAFDHVERVVVAFGRGATREAAGRLATAAMTGLDAPPDQGVEGRLVQDLAGEDPAVYEAQVAEVIERIAAGEIFQANIARAWRGRLQPGARPFDVMARLAGESPAPFAAYLRLPGRTVVSNSPERFLGVRADGGLTVETRPIKGTRPRGATPAEDARLAAELSASAKDRAENLMIVDLMRNDLARVCPPGSVAVPELFRVERFANVQHLVSTVTARAAPGLTIVDLLRAAFPPGSVTGAPKVQAMKVIAGLEPPRGPYCGSLFWAGADGAADSSVLIRTAAFVEDGAGWRVEARAGAGIVSDSDPAAERRETEAKIAALRRALTGPAA